MNGMIDLHSHILSGLDDGSRNLEESIQMCRASYRDGVRAMVATPHTLTGLYQNDRITILSKVRELNDPGEGQHLPPKPLADGEGEDQQSGYR